MMEFTGHILDRQFNTLTTMDNSLPGAVHFYSDKFHLYLAEAASTFDFTIDKKNPDYEYFIEGNYVWFEYHGRDYLMTIRRIEENEFSMSIQAESLSFDLLNEFLPPYSASQAYSIQDYLSGWITGSGIVIGLNEVSKAKLKLAWDGQATVLERIKSLANYFGAEFEFVPVLNDDRSLNQITMNIYKEYSEDGTNHGVGAKRTDIELRYGENVSEIRRVTDITEIFTSIKPTGKDGLLITNLEKKEYDENGNLLFYTKKGGWYIYAPQSNAKYGRSNSEKGGYISNSAYTYETTNVNTLYGQALAQLKKYCNPSITYEVTGYYDLDLGDTVSIRDEKYNPALLLEARVSEMILSFTEPENNQTTFTNYKVFQSQISDSLLQMQKDLEDKIEAAKTPIFRMDVKGSTVFKNDEGSLALTMGVTKANQDVTDQYPDVNWIKTNKDGSIDETWTEAHRGFGALLEVERSDFDDSASFSYEVKVGDVWMKGATATVVNVNDGEDGKTPIKGVDYFDGEDGTNGLSAYLHIKYSQNSNGNPMTSDPTGAKYVGMQVSQNPNPSTVPADYDWTLVKGADGISGETGADGKTSYLHIKYSNDGGQTFTGNGGEDVGTWIGQYVDFTQADSTDVKKYAWSKIKGDDGKPGADGKPGSNGVSVSSVVEEYYVSTSPNSQAGGSWSTTVPNNADPNKYIWRRLKTTMSNGTVTYTNPALIQGMTGIYPYIGPTQPANPKEGQQWWKSDASGNITNFYVYKSGSWQGQTIQQSVLNIIALNAVTITGSTITGTTINGSKLMSSFTKSVMSNTRAGSTIIENGQYKTTYQEKNSAGTVLQNGIINIDEYSFSNAIYNGSTATGRALASVALQPQGLFFTASALEGYTGQLTMQDSLVIPETALTNSNSNWAVYATSGSSKPVAMRKGRNITLSGAFKPTKVLPSTGGDAQTLYPICTLPVGLRPEKQMVFMNPGSGIRLFWLTVDVNGVVSASRNRNEGGYNDFNLGGFYSIACNFPAADI